MRRILLICTLFSISIIAKSQDLSAYQKRWIVQGADTLPYRILLPLNFDATKTYPVVFFLHGSGERGKDNEMQLVHGAKLFLKDEVRKNYPAIVVFPQCSPSGYWSITLRALDGSPHVNHIHLADGEPTRDMRMLQLLVGYILDSYPVDKSRLYVGGLSMGGMGTFELVKRNPGLFAAAFPICGGANPATAPSMKRTAWWIFHGAKDDVIFPADSKNIFNALKKENANVQLTIYPEANHNSWDATFAEPGLLPWMFKQHR